MVALAAVLTGVLQWFAGPDRPAANAHATAAEIDAARLERESESTETTAVIAADGQASALVQTSKPNAHGEARSKVSETASALGSATWDKARHPGEAVTAVSADSEAVATDSVIGRPFPISPSVRAAGCVRDDNCAWLDEMLSTFAGEARDVGWATEMEARLRSLVMSEAGKYAIRAIECRTSKCLVEVASIHGQYFGDIPEDDPLHKQVLEASIEWGTELDPSSGRTTVTVAAFRRR